MGRKRKKPEITGDGENFVSLNLSSETKRTIFAIFLFLLSLIFILGFFESGGLIGKKLTQFVGLIFGWGKYLTPLVLISAGIILIRKKTTIFYITKIIGTFVIFFSTLALLHIFFNSSDFLEIAESGKGGGYIGYFIASFIIRIADKLVGTIILSTTLIIGFIITYNISFSDVKKKIPTEKLDVFKKKGKGEDENTNFEEENNFNEHDSFFEEKRNGLENNNNLNHENDTFFEQNSKDEREYYENNFSNKPQFIQKLNESTKKESEEDLFKDFDDFDDFKNELIENFEDENNQKLLDNDFYQNDESRIKIIERKNLKKVTSNNKDHKYTNENKENNFVSNFVKKSLEDNLENNEKTKLREINKKPLVKKVKWSLPPLNLVEESVGKAQGGDVNKNAQTIKDTLSYFGINVELDNIVTGPTVTRYSFRPPMGVKLSKITSLNADLALALAAHPIRIEAPIPGKSLVGIEVPNRTNVAVRMRDLVKSNSFQHSKAMLPLALGKDINGELIIADLAKMPHLLVAGATGTGKSVTINSILISLLYHNSPENLKLILVDPKRVELSLYNGIPHLLADVIVDNDKVLNALKWAISEMERRYKLLQETGSRDLKSYNEKKKAGEMRVYKDPETGEGVTEKMENLPMIVIVMDELADLMASHGKDVEGAIVRLAQMSRAIGIHLIVSTQRPSVEVITGLIKANLPTRISLRVATGIDSRTILDTLGAEKLIGQGDMLFMAPNSVSPQRLQGVYVEENEVKRVVDFIKNQNFDFDDDLTENFKNSEEVKNYSSNSNGISSVDFDNMGNAVNSSDEDSLYPEAKDLVIQAGKASTSYIQRRLRVGYARAARLIDILEENGIVGPADGSKPRQVLVGEKSSSSSKEIDNENPEEEQMKRDNWQM